ncbi:MAG: acyl-CoA carboxylase subunit beta [Firmicutes bacterium]|nr:acyl-CoA carboxylase subunit beta [Bacillota bacterium]
MGAILEYQTEKQHANRKYHAIERIHMLLDRNSFSEIGSGMADYSHCAGGSGGGAVPYDGVITGRGKVRGKTVFIFSQDFTVKGGTIGRRHGEKIANTIRLAITAKCPVVGIYDSGGARIQEGINALAGCGEMIYYNTLASGFIPQFSVVVGACAGAAAYSPAITDFIFMVDNVSSMFVTGASVIKSVTGEECTNFDLGGAAVHNRTSGVAHRRFGNEKDCFRSLRDLVEILPASCGSKEQRTDFYVDQNTPPIEGILPVERRMSYDIRKLVNGLIDENTFFEIEDEYAKSVVVGFARLSGATIGVVANQPAEIGGVLTCDTSDKAARFIRFCDCFNVPIVTFVDTPGYLPGIDQEHSGIIRHGAKLLFAYSEASVPKITVIVRKAYGGAYIAMGSKHMRADYVYAFEGAEIAVMGAEGAVAILNKNDLDRLRNPGEAQAFLAERTAEYEKSVMTVRIARQEGLIDEVVTYDSLRKRIFDDITALGDKRETQSVQKKHGNIPL